MDSVKSGSMKAVAMALLALGEDLKRQSVTIRGRSGADEVLRILMLLQYSRMRRSYFEDVAAFHEKMRQPYDGPPRLLDNEILRFRTTFRGEECHEFDLAYENGDIVKAADSLVDEVYVALGTAYMMGLPFDLLWSIVHSRANMSKVPAGTPGENAHALPLYKKFKIVKPDGWVAPDDAIAAVLEAKVQGASDEVALSRADCIKVGA